MLLVISFCRKDRQLAERQAEWIAELGPYPAHQLLSVRDVKAAPIGYNAAGFGEVKEIVVRDAPDSWPEGPNTMMARAGKQIEHVQKVPWLWFEPDAVPMRAGWLDEIEAEYAKALLLGRVFLGDLQRPLPGKPHFVPHSSGLCVYPAALTQHAGEAYMAGNVPFDTVAGPSVVPKMMQSELLYHVWKSPPFESWADVERRIFAVRPKCAVYHSDKSGSLLGLLRERKNFSEDVLLRTNEAIKTLARSWPLDRTECAPPAENNLPVPVLAESGEESGYPFESETLGEARASTTESQSPNPADLQGQADARGGQFISVPLGGKGAYGIECTCLKHEFPCPFHFRDYESSNERPTSDADIPLRQYVDGPPPIAKDQIWAVCDPNGAIVNTYEFDGEKWVEAKWPRANSEYAVFTFAAEVLQTPWASKADSIAEIRQLAARLMQFSDSSPHVRLVRAELHDAGVIRLDYRYRKRRGWKRKKGRKSPAAL